MKPKKAINILKIQLEKLDDPHNRDESWIFQTASYIKDFFGENSTEYSFITQFKFIVLTSSADSKDDILRWLSEKPILARQFLNNCIETIEHKGLFTQPKINFLNRMSDTALWTILGIGIPGLISIGLFFGNLYSDKQNNELRQTNHLLEKELLKVKSDLNSLQKYSNDTLKLTQNKK